MILVLSTLVSLIYGQLIGDVSDLVLLTLGACADGTVDTTAVAAGSSVDLTGSLAVCFAAQTAGVLELTGAGETMVLTGAATTKEVALSVATGATLLVRGTNDYLTNFTCDTTANVALEAGASLSVMGSSSIHLSGELSAESETGTGTCGSSGNVLVLSDLTIEKNATSTMDFSFYGSATLGASVVVNADVDFHDDADAEEGDVTVASGRRATFYASLSGMPSISGEGAIIITSGSGEAEVEANERVTVGSVTVEAGAMLTLATAAALDAAVAVTSGATLAVKGHAEATSAAVSQATVNVEAAADADVEASLAVSGSCSFDTVEFVLSGDAGDKVILAECEGGIDASVDLTVSVAAAAGVSAKREDHENDHDQDEEEEYEVKVEGNVVVAHKKDHDGGAASLALSGALVAAAVSFISM